jgi:outer membrane cobalamin receptor
MASTVLAGMSTSVALAQDGQGGPTEVVVTAKRLEKTARAEQKAALNIVNIQPAETIEKYPDFNAAEALGRVVGVSMSEDTGEGRFVEIRGIDGNLNGATFGGVVLLNTNPGGT